MKVHLPGGNLGFVVALFATLTSAYEFAGIADGQGGIPTISRLVQGLRDSGSIGSDVVSVLTALVAAALVGFAGWVTHHFIRDRRSSL